MIKDISRLSREEKLAELLKTFYISESRISYKKQLIDDDFCHYLDDVIDNIWYISDTPNFEFENFTIFSKSYSIKTKEDICKFFNERKNSVFIWVNVCEYTLVSTSFETYSNYVMCGEFIDNTKNFRDKKIGDILG